MEIVGREEENCFWGQAGERRRKFPPYECTHGTSILIDAGAGEKRRKIICTASLLADPISGSTMNRGRRSKYAFYPLQVHAIRFIEDMREPRYSYAHCFPMNF